MNDQRKQQMYKQSELYQDQLDNVFITVNQLKDESLEDLKKSYEKKCLDEKL